MASRVRKDTQVLQRLIRETPGKTDALLRGAGQEIVNEIVLSFSPTSPSAPGTPPGVDSGELRASMTATPDGPGRVLVHDGVAYGVYQELGTEKMPARPFVSPIFERWRQGEFARFARDFGILD